MLIWLCAYIFYKTHKINKNKIGGFFMLFILSCVGSHDKKHRLLNQFSSPNFIVQLEEDLCGTYEQ